MIASNISDAFNLEPGRVRLNPASYGVRPRAVQEAQRLWRERIERNPEAVLRDEVPGILARIREEATAWIGATGGDAQWEASVSAAVGKALLASRPGPDRPIIVTHACYPDVWHAVRTTAAATGAPVRAIDLPEQCARAVVSETLDAHISEVGAVVVLEAVTSPTAQALALDALVPRLRARGHTVIVDGAHAPGLLAVDVAAIQPDYYAAGFSKWAFAPPGCAMLWARDRTRLTDLPGAGSVDPTPWLALPTALAFHEAIGGERIRRHNADLAEAGVAALVDQFGLVPVPAGEGLGMRALAVPWAKAGQLPAFDALRRTLSVRDRVEIAFTATGGRLYLRIAAHVTTGAGDVGALARALRRHGWP